MRLSTTFCALLLLTPAGAALAQDDGYGYRFQPGGDSGLSGFAGLRGSLAFAGNLNTTVPPATAANAKLDSGAGGSIYVGTRLPFGLRLELEGLYRDQSLSGFTLGGTAVTATGHSSIAAPMLNLLWDLPVPDFPMRPFIGGGVGGAYVQTNVHDATNTNIYARNNNWNFAYQLIGGAEIPLSQSSRFTAMYRWMKVNDVAFQCGLSGIPTSTCKSDLTSQSIDLGLEMDM